MNCINGEGKCIAESKNDPEKESLAISATNSQQIATVF